jgi:hypothetical protein
MSSMGEVLLAFNSNIPFTHKFECPLRRIRKGTLTYSPNSLTISIVLTETAHTQRCVFAMSAYFPTKQSPHSKGLLRRENTASQ